MRVSKITVGRLYNLGSYEHVRYEISLDVAPGESAAKAMIGLERIVKALAPEKSACVKTHDELRRELANIERMRADLATLGEETFRQRHGFFEGTAKQYIKRCFESWKTSRKKRIAWDRRSAKARAKLDSVGGASKWKDAKLDWENDNDFED